MRSLNDWLIETGWAHRQALWSMILLNALSQLSVVYFWWGLRFKFATALIYYIAAFGFWRNYERY